MGNKWLELWFLTPSKKALTNRKVRPFSISPWERIQRTQSAKDTYVLFKFTKFVCPHVSVKISHQLDTLPIHKIKILATMEILKQHSGWVLVLDIFFYFQHLPFIKVMRGILAKLHLKRQRSQRDRQKSVIKTFYQAGEMVNSKVFLWDFYCHKN